MRRRSRGYPRRQIVSRVPLCRRGDAQVGCDDTIRLLQIRTARRRTAARCNFDDATEGLRPLCPGHPGACGGWPSRPRCAHGGGCVRLAGLLASATADRPARTRRRRVGQPRGRRRSPWPRPIVRAGHRVHRATLGTPTGPGLGHGPHDDDSRVLRRDHGLRLQVRIRNTHDPRSRRRTAHRRIGWLPPSTAQCASTSPLRWCSSSDSANCAAQAVTACASSMPCCSTAAVRRCWNGASWRSIRSAGLPQTGDTAPRSQRRSPRRARRLPLRRPPHGCRGLRSTRPLKPCGQEP